MAASLSLGQILAHPPGSDPFAAGQELHQRLGQPLAGLDLDRRDHALAEQVRFPVVMEKFLALRDNGPRLTERP